MKVRALNLRLQDKAVLKEVSYSGMSDWVQINCSLLKKLSKLPPIRSLFFADSLLSGVFAART